MARYATNTDLNSFFRDFDVKYYGTYWDDDPRVGSCNEQSALDRDLDRETAYINAKLSAMGYRTPLNTLGTSGTYDQQITEWCSMSVIYKRLVYKHGDDYQDGLPEDVSYFKTRAVDIEKAIVDGGLALDVDTTMEESGIGFAYAGGTAGTSPALFYNNKEYGGIYDHDHWEGRFIVQIDSTAGGNDIGKATFKWSRDGGHSYEDTEVLTSTNWTSLMSGIKVRWHPVGTTTDQLHTNDWWYFDVIPMNKKAKGYKNVAKVKTFARG